MDIFFQKFEVLLLDVVVRFKDFNYGLEMFREEVENYKRFVERLESFIVDIVYVMNELILEKKKILVEGGQVIMLDIDFGIYLFVIFFSLLVGGICIGFGIVFRVIGDFVGVVSGFFFVIMFFLCICCFIFFVIY